MKLIESINEAVRNAEEFNRIEADSGLEALRRFSHFYHWYYFSHLSIFAPSKFIGYKGSSIDNYIGGGTGSATQRALSKWFTKVNPSSRQYDLLKRKLIAYAKSLGKQIGRRTFDGSGAIYILSDEFATSNYPDEIEGSGYVEGATMQVSVNAYERSARARSDCIDHYGARCYVCGFDFSEMYGNDLGAGFIHVHHLIDMSAIGREYIVNPIADLRTLCPNCHAMVHKRKPAISPDELKKIIAENT